VRTHVLVQAGHLERPLSAAVSSSALPAESTQAAAAIEDVLRDRTIDVLVFWDLRLGPVPLSLVESFRGSVDDAWLAAREGTERDLLRYAEPVWIYRRPPAPDAKNAVTWHFDVRAAIVRTEVLRALGGLDPSFDTLAGAAKELGLRMIRRGAICRQKPELTPAPLPCSEPSLADDYRLLRRSVSRTWAAYSLVRRVVDAPANVRSELRAWGATSADAAPPPAAAGVLERDLTSVRLPTDVAVSVVLPTFGRYRYVAEVLEDLRAQTIRPTQILIADGNPSAERKPDVYARFADLPIEVLWHEEQGICSGRNACLRRVTGDYVWFVDDDSRFDARNLEQHLRTLQGYGADVSVGPAYTKGRPDLAPEQRETACAFMDCGTTVVRRDLLAKTGGFDMQFNYYLRGEDNDLGIRFVREGGLVLNNPHAKRFHYLAPVGGSRSKGSPHVFRRWSLRPRPVQSIYYLARRHFDPAAAWDSMLQGCIAVGWRPKPGVPATRGWRARNLIAELGAMPLTCVRFFRSYRIGLRMFREGPIIPPIDAAESRQSSAC